MRVPFLGDRRGGPEEAGDPDEWDEVPIYTTIKRTAEPWVIKAFNLHAVGVEHVPLEGGAVLASNHASYFDPVFLGAVLPRPVRYMAKSDLFRHPLLRAFFTRAGQVKIDRVSGGNQAAVNTCVRLVEQDRIVGVFPEGTRSMDGKLRPGRTGVARVALRTGAPIIPAALTSHEVLPKFARFPNLDKPLVIAVGEPLRFEGMAEAATDRATCRKVTDEVMSEIARLLEVARTRQAALVYEEDA